MEEKKVDRRIAKTKKAIYRAFAQLLSEKNINDITIKDIADRADINRKRSTTTTTASTSLPAKSRTKSSTVLRKSSANTTSTNFCTIPTKCLTSLSKSSTVILTSINI